jgi:O-antigen ligase
MPAFFLKNKPSPRLLIVCLAATSVGLAMAIISLAKALLLVGGTAVLIAAWCRKDPAGTPPRPFWTPLAVLLALAGMALTLFWTAAPMDEALVALGKHGKLLVIPLLVCLIHTRREAVLALACFAGAQLFTVLSSWMLILHLPVPWASAGSALVDHAVFTSHLDQPIMMSVFAALCWQLRGLVPGRRSLYLVAAVILLALGNVLFFMEGRTGHVAAIGLLSLALIWEFPRRYKFAAVAVPFVVVLVLVAGSSKLRERLFQVGTEVNLYEQTANIDTSSSQRLNFWRRSLQAIQERPLTGHGVGSWNQEYNRLEGGKGRSGTDVVRNPHQEYLLWGVEAGIGGLLLFCGVLLAMLRDALRLPTQEYRAALSVLAAMALSCLFNSSIFDATIGDFFCVAMGLTLALGLRSTARHGA